LYPHLWQNLGMNPRLGWAHFGQNIDGVRAKLDVSGRETSPGFVMTKTVPHSGHRAEVSAVRL
jgi:hypothetical protein